MIYDHKDGLRLVWETFGPANGSLICPQTIVTISCILSYFYALQF